jgi:hypothetical protein
MTITAKTIEHSIAPHGGELITLELCLPERIHKEILRHRMFSFSVMSTRATPYRVMRNEVMENPYIPLVWTWNGTGMQPKEEMPPEEVAFALDSWMTARDDAVFEADQLDKLGVHKSDVTTLISPFLMTKMLVTATEWNNFFALRLHKDAKVEMQVLAKRMAEAIRDSAPTARAGRKSVLADHWKQTKNWHLPYVTQEERDEFPDSSEPYLAKISAARCARVSYFTRDGKKSDIMKDLKLYDRLVSGDNVEASPLEHQGYPDFYRDTWHGNFQGWFQFRKMIPNESQPNFPWLKRLEEYGDRDYILG